MQQLKAHKNLSHDLNLTQTEVLEMRNGETVRLYANRSHDKDSREKPVEPWVNDEEINFAPAETVFARSRMSQAGVLLGFLSPGKDQIRLEGRALGNWDFEGVLNRLQNQMTDYLMEHFDDPHEIMNPKLCRMVNHSFRNHQKNSPYFILM